MSREKHNGVNTHRLKYNPMEKVFAEKWKEENNNKQNRSILKAILSKDYNNMEEITQRDATVAATVIQWLGSTVGNDFLKQCKEEIENG